MDASAARQSPELRFERGPGYPFEQRAAVELAYYVGLSCEEIGKVMQSPTNTIKTRMLHVRRKLRAAFDADSGETTAIVPRS